MLRHARAVEARPHLRRRPGRPAPRRAGLGRLPDGRARATAELDQGRDLDPRGAGGGAPAADGARRGQAQIAAAQAAQQQAAQATVVGASAATPEGATVVPSSSLRQPGGLDRDVVHRRPVRLGRRVAGRVRLLRARDVLVRAARACRCRTPRMRSGTTAATSTTATCSRATSSSSTALGHVGLYIGGGEFVDAPYTGAYVRVDSLTSGWAARSLLRRSPDHHLSERGNSPLIMADAFSNVKS